MALEASEAQRLMVLSLGKIGRCRQQRGGINLHKSLLVTKVLYRARSVALSQPTSPKEEESDDQTVPDIDIQCDETEPEPVHEEQTAGNTHPCELSGTCEEDEQSPHSHDHSHDYDQEKEYLDMDQNKENTCPDNTTSLTTKPRNFPVHCSEDFADSPKIDKSISCSRRTKRRLTEVELAVDSISPKKQRQEEEEESDCEYTSEYHTLEPMQVDNSPQISNLVNRFSAGFTGLLANDTDSSTLDSSSESHSSENQGLSSADSLLSCSTQIKESFELLARPIIALSV